MLYFRFDFRKEDFKGANHQSVLYGYEVEDRVDFLFEEEKIRGYYLDEYKKLQKQFFEDNTISEEEYDKKLNDLKQEYIDDELTLDGCSCFELTEKGIESAINYGYDDRPIVTIFEGHQIGDGHDGEIVAKCEKTLWQGNAKIITNIMYDDDIENKVEEILKIIK